jgi:uncharacterized protein YbdZ (MbtH family)
MAQRRPSTATRVSIAVPAGHQVVKKARSPLAILRRIRRLKWTLDLGPAG